MEADIEDNDELLTELHKNVTKNVLSQLYKVRQMFYLSSIRYEKCLIPVLQGKTNVLAQLYKGKTNFLSQLLQGKTNALSQLLQGKTNVQSQLYKVRQMLCKTYVLSQLNKVLKMFYPSSARSENCSISALQGKQNVQSQFFKVQKLFNLSSTR